jgi:hypothetical protein
MNFPVLLSLAYLNFPWRDPYFRENPFVAPDLSKGLVNLNEYNFSFEDWIMIFFDY